MGAVLVCVNAILQTGNWSAQCLSSAIQPPDPSPVCRCHKSTLRLHWPVYAIHALDMISPPLASCQIHMYTHIRVHTHKSVEQANSLVCGWMCAAYYLSRATSAGIHTRIHTHTHTHMCMLQTYVRALTHIYAYHIHARVHHTQRHTFVHAFTRTRQFFCCIESE